MDKRTLLFIVSLTLALFGVRVAFDYLNQDKKQEWLTEQAKRAESEKAQKLKEQEEAKQTSDHSPFPVSSNAANQEYYVLENSYIQLVFSNIGGAITEINLPFKSAKNQQAEVLPIEIDREILAVSPQNSRFPLYPAKNADGQIKEGSLGGYYPLIRRNIIGKDGKTSFRVSPNLYSCNIVSEYPEVAELVYEVKKISQNEIVMQASQPHRRITKTFKLPEDDVPYCFQLDVKIEGDARGLSITSGVPEIEWQSGTSGSVIKYRITRGKSHEVLKVDLPAKSYTLSTIFPDWVCDSNGFFGIIMDPKKGHEAGFKVEKILGDQDVSRLSIIDPDNARFSKEETPGYNVLLPVKPQAGNMEIRLFSGPFGDNVLKKVDEYFAKKEGTSSDYLSCQTYFGWFAFISEPFAKAMFFIMKLCYNFTHSWALSIVFVTIVLRLLLYPLNTWSIRSMKGMQEVGPQVKLIQEKYKKEPTRAQAEIIALYRSKGVNPLSGCLPLLLQIPFLVGMFDLLKTTFELRGAVFIPGWIDNLTSPDVLFSWTTPIPFIGNEFHLLPIILGVIMYVQQNVMSSMPKDRSTWTEQQRQQRAMGNIMTVVMTVLFYNFPSGLNIYWISSMLFGIVQQWWITKKQNTKANEAVLEVQVPHSHHKRRHK